PGQIARYLHHLGVDTLGVDLSTNMVAEAQRLNPEIHFHQGDMLSLPDADNSWGGMAAFYCIIHIPCEQIVDALREMKRVLKPGGILLITFHIGTEIKHLHDWWEKPVNLDFAFYLPNEMESWLKEAGFELEETLVREPIPKWKPQPKGHIYSQGKTCNKNGWEENSSQPLTNPVMYRPDF
ncbi:MAG: class I SAM-dependent methyltransferase, partial [Anaerolineales bacterium]